MLHLRHIMKAHMLTTFQGLKNLKKVKKLYISQIWEKGDI